MIRVNEGSVFQDDIRIPLDYMLEHSYEQLLKILSDRHEVGKIGKAVALSVSAYVVSKKLYDAFMGPLSSLPGPFITRFLRIRRANLDKPLGTAWEKQLELHHQYGKVVRMGPRAISTADKEMIRDVLVKKDLKKAPMYGLLASTQGSATMFSTREKDFHKQRRRVVSPAFSMKYLGSLEVFMDNTTDAFLKRINEDIAKTADTDGYGTVDMWVLFQCLALDIIGETAFGQSFDMLENNDHFVPKTITGSMKAAHYFMTDPLIGPLLAKVPFLRRNIDANRKRLADFMRNIIVERLTDPSKARNDILQILIDTQHAHSDDDRLTPDAIANETVLFLVAGSETTSNTSGFALIELLRHPEAMAKLREEIDQVPLEEGQKLFKHEQLKHLPYLNGVINESLRIDWIGTGGLDRIATEDTLIGGKLLVPKGTLINCNVYHAQMDPDYWPEPEKFMPERWAEDANPPPETDAFYPFSAGSRNCIGKNFALQEMRISLATLVKYYDLKPIPQELEDAKDIRQYLTLQVTKNSFKCLVKPRGQ
ncbi:cytochrome P450 [Syncephalastrum racemosum]|uniref:Cytochrome P450 n=1 Tax=Syncephalastrum racemosum TaxID=13706 RepID=A0A1X2HL37_SYNRA|nr:cytochrome P450 [Syncephalastrum racemosum]